METARKNRNRYAGSQFNVFNINHIEHFYNAPGCNNEGDGYGRCAFEDAGEDSEAEEIRDAEEAGAQPLQLSRPEVRRQMLAYVMRLHPRYVAPLWQPAYQPLWEDILQQPEVEELLLGGRHQQGVPYNRRQLCRIIHYLHVGQKVLRESATNTELGVALEGTDDAKVRTQFSYLPEGREVCQVLAAAVARHRPAAS